MIYSRICHNQLKKYNQRSEQYVIFIGVYNSENHKCGVTRCIRKK